MSEQSHAAQDRERRDSRGLHGSASVEPSGPASPGTAAYLYKHVCVECGKVVRSTEPPGNGYLICGPHDAEGKPLAARTPRFEVRVEFTGYSVVDTSRRNKIAAWYPNAAEAEAVASHWNEESRLGRI